MLVLGMLDWYFIQMAYTATLTQGASVQLVFGFEYAILLTMVAMVAVKYGLHTFDINRENPWEEKAVFLLYAELAVGKCTSWLAYIRVNTNSSSLCFCTYEC